MIIRIRQTSVGLKNRYDIESDGVLFQGERGGLHDAQHIIMMGGGVTLTGCFALPSATSLIPLASLAGVEQKSRVYELQRNGGAIGRVFRSAHGWGKSCYVIELTEGTTLRCYSRCRGQFDHVAIYAGNEQIALLENFLRQVDGKHDHKLYLLDAHRQHAEVLSWFAMYYAQHEVAEKGDMTFTISFSRYNKMVDPAWREKHFPQENFFGKINRFD